MSDQNKICLFHFIQYTKTISHNTNRLQKLKRRLSEAVAKIEDYIQCFKTVDLDKKAVIYPKILQNYLINHKFYFQPASIARYYSKYAHEKSYLAYQDILQAILPHQDFMLVAHTITNPPQITQRQSKFTYTCAKDRIKMIESFTAQVIANQMKYLNQDYHSMRNITKNSQRIGAILWRLLDRNHNNQLNYHSMKITCGQFGIDLKQYQWYNFLYWHMHSYKKTINRDDFIRILNIHQERKRATSACKIEKFKVEQQLYKRAEQDRLKKIRIEKAVEQKLLMMPHLQTHHFKNMVKQQHFPFQYLNVKTQLKGPKGYSNPKNLIKYAVQRD